MVALLHFIEFLAAFNCTCVVAFYCILLHFGSIAIIIYIYSVEDFLIAVNGKMATLTTDSVNN